MPRLKGYGKAPYIDLREARKIVEKIAHEGAGRVTHEHLAIMLQHSAGSSVFLNKIIALKRYGLLEKSGKDEYHLTNLGFELAEGQNKDDALFRAFLYEPLHRDVHERYKGKLLLSNEALKNILEKEFAVMPKHSEEWVTRFLRNLEEANLITRTGGTPMILSVSEQRSPVGKVVNTGTGVPKTTEKTLLHPREEPSAKPKFSLTYTLQDGGEIQIRILKGIEQGEWNTLKQMLKPLVKQDQNERDPLPNEESEENTTE